MPTIHEHFGEGSKAPTARVIHGGEKTSALDTVETRIDTSVEITLRRPPVHPDSKERVYTKKKPTTPRGAGAAGGAASRTTTLTQEEYFAICFRFYKKLWPIASVSLRSSLGAKEAREGFEVLKCVVSAPTHPLSIPPFSATPTVSKLEVARDTLHYYYPVRERIAQHDFPSLSRGPLPSFDPLGRILNGRGEVGSLFVGSSQYLFGFEPSDKLLRMTPKSFSKHEAAWVEMVKKRPLVTDNIHKIHHLVGLGTASSKFPEKGFAGCTVQNLLFTERALSKESAKKSVNLFLNTLMHGRRITKDTRITPFVFEVERLADSPFFVVAQRSLSLDPAMNTQTLHLFFERSFLPIVIALRRGINVLVFDDRGVNRSIAFVLLFLMYFRGITLDNAFGYVRERKHLAIVSPLMWSVLREFERLFIVCSIIR